jgi:hypothetical protein
MAAGRGLGCSNAAILAGALLLLVQAASAQVYLNSTVTFTSPVKPFTDNDCKSVSIYLQVLAWQPAYRGTACNFGSFTISKCCSVNRVMHAWEGCLCARE